MGGTRSKYPQQTLLAQTADTLATTEELIRVNERQREQLTAEVQQLLPRHEEAGVAQQIKSRLANRAELEITIRELHATVQTLRRQLATTQKARQRVEVHERLEAMADAVDEAHEATGDFEATRERLARQQERDREMASAFTCEETTAQADAEFERMVAMQGLKELGVTAAPAPEHTIEVEVKDDFASVF